jgi:hypothetical protein
MYVYVCIFLLCILLSACSVSERGIWHVVFGQKQICLRFVVLVTVVAFLLGFRIYLLNGQLPRFNNEDNPASFSSSLLTRVLTYNYLYAANGELLIAPTTLSYDWQGGSIPLLEGVEDWRNAKTVVFYVVLVLLGVRGLVNIKKPDCATVMGLALVIVPFLSASNMFFRVGFVLAERVLYIPR